MLAIYARQSVDRQDSVSIESQIEFCQYETKGQPFETYVDKGFSGKNTDRPAFQRLTEDIKSGKISRVIVYKLDRISRSILDFSNMMEMFQQYKVEFISSTEKFDTSTPMGRAMLNICIVFAQLERETIQKRVIDTYISRSQKGFYMGGRVPYGYRLVDTVMHGVKTSMYIQEPEEAENIRVMYELYQNPSVSYGDVTRYFDERSILNRGRKWDRTTLPFYLSNSAYVMADRNVFEFYKNQGIRIINDEADFSGVNGCYLYAGENVSSEPNENGSYLVIAPHTGIVPSDIWLKCRIKCLKNKEIQPARKITNSWLAGKLKCGNCGYALSRKTFRKKHYKYSYYFCTYRLKTNGCVGCGKLTGDGLEEDIYLEIVEKLAEFETLSASNQTSFNPKLAKLQAELQEIETQIADLINAVSALNPALLSYINEKVTELDARKQAVLKAIKDLSVSALDSEQLTALQGYMAKWHELSMDDKRQVANVLIRTIRATDKVIVIDWNF